MLCGVVVLLDKIVRCLGRVVTLLTHVVLCGDRTSDYFGWVML